VSFTFGLPSEHICEAVRRLGAVAVATVTTAGEAVSATAVGVDALVTQGSEAGGHRGVYHDDGVSVGGGDLIGRRELLLQARDVTSLPVLTAGGLTSGTQIAEGLSLGAIAAVLGTVFLCCPESGTPEAHRQALLSRRYRETIVTRAFTGRPARGLRNEFADRFDVLAPASYPEVHRMTQPLRAAAAAAGDPTNLHLWAGTGWQAVTTEPVATVVARLERERVAATA
jgi:nitronate monooxygenase